MFFSIYKTPETPETIEDTPTIPETIEETPETIEETPETPDTPETVKETIEVVNKSFFNHLNENECSYINHFTNALKYSSISLKASFYFFIHAIFPDFYIDTGSKTINSLNRIIKNHTYIKNRDVTEIQLERIEEIERDDKVDR
jgi:hypothetical protein